LAAMKRLAESRHLAIITALQDVWQTCRTSRFALPKL
jgi:hypothetical protein